MADYLTRPWLNVAIDPIASLARVELGSGMVGSPFNIEVATYEVLPVTRATPAMLKVKTKAKRR